jgi:NADP-dependent 3-hydroxy acid dehydrogenase YdfG
MNTPWVDKKSTDYLEPEDVADAIYYIATRPKHILIPEFSIVPR